VLDVALPVSIQNLKNRIDRERTAKIAQTAVDKREKGGERPQKQSTTQDRCCQTRQKPCFLSKKRRTRIDTASTPLKLCSSSAPNSSSWEMSDFDDSDLNITEIFSMKDKILSVPLEIPDKGAP